MNLRNLISVGLGLVSALAVFGVVSQHQQLVRLQTEQSRVLAQIAASTSDSSAAPAAEQETPAPAPNTDPELLRLRAEVTQLSARRRELEGVATENERLRAQLASRGTNANARLLLVSKARFVGYRSPENTLESLLWSVQQRDFNKFLNALAPAVAQAWRSETEEAWRNSMKAFQERMSGVIIVGRRDLLDGRIELDVEMMLPSTTAQPLHFQQFDREWKLLDFN